MKSKNIRQTSILLLLVYLLSMLNIDVFANTTSIYRQIPDNYFSNYNNYREYRDYRNNTDYRNYEYDDYTRVINDVTTTIIINNQDDSSNYSTPTPKATPFPGPYNTPIPIYYNTPTPTPTPTPYYIRYYIPTPTPRPFPGAIAIDLAISLSADKTKYSNGQTITYTIDYKNLTNAATGQVMIYAEIPQYTSVENASGGSVTGNTIQWKYNNLPALYSGRIVYTVKVGKLNKPEVYTNNTATIKALEDTQINPNDDKSSIKVLLFNTEMNTGYHELYIVGYPENLFKPDNFVTRAEVATILTRISGIRFPENIGGIYSDVPTSHWACGFISSASQTLGLFSGYPDGSFKPDEPISRAELAIVTTKYLKTGNPAPFVVHFKDSAFHWAKNYIEEAYRNKLVTGYDDQTFRPNELIRRSEMVVMVNKMLYRGPLSVVQNTFPDVTSTHWAFGHVEEASINHSFKRDTYGNEILIK